MDYEYLDEKSVNAQVIMQLLKRAFIKCELDEDGDIRFNMDGYKGYIEIDDKRKTLRFLMVFGLSETATDLEKLELVARLNANIIFNQFYIHNDSIFSSYYLLFEEGLPSYQLIASLKRFVNIAISSFAEEDLVA